MKSDAKALIHCTDCGLSLPLVSVDVKPNFITDVISKKYENEGLLKRCYYSGSRLLKDDCDMKN